MAAEFEYFLSEKPISLEQVLEKPTGEFIVHPLGAEFLSVNYNLGYSESRFHLFLMKDSHKSENRFSAPNRCQITGRTISEYRHHFLTRPDYKTWGSELEQNLLFGKVIEVAPGLSEFGIDLARQRLKVGSSPLIVIEAFDYKIMRELLIQIKEVFHREIGVYGKREVTYTEVLERVSILLNPKYVTLHQHRLNRQLSHELIPLKNTADVVIDMFGACAYSPNRAKTIRTVKSLLKKGGIPIIVP